MLVSSTLSLFTSVQDSRPRNDATYSQGGSSYFD